MSEEAIQRRIQQAVEAERKRCVDILWAVMSLDHDCQDTPGKERALYDEMRKPRPKKVKP